MPPEVIVDEPSRLAEAAVRIVTAERERALADHGAFAVALSGGSAATALFPSLAALDWSRTEVFWADERAVPPDDPESNYGMARRLLLEPAAVPAERVHRMEADAPDLERAAAAYAQTLVRLLGTPTRLDLALLGVGPDGHVASLFPNHAALSEAGRLAVPVFDAPKPPPRRLTLTLPALTSSRRLLVFATGRAKAKVIGAALTDTSSRLPVASVTRPAAAVTFLLDPEAAEEAAIGATRP